MWAGEDFNQESAGMDDQRLPCQARRASEGHMGHLCLGRCSQTLAWADPGSFCLHLLLSLHCCRLMETSSAEEQISRAISGCSFSE